MIKQFINAFGISGVEGLLADREYASGQLLAWLNRQSIPFCIRIKEGSTVCVGKKKIWTAKKLFRNVQPTLCEIFPMRVNVFGTAVYLVPRLDSN